MSEVMRHHPRFSATHPYRSAHLTHRLAGRMKAAHPRPHATTKREDASMSRHDEARRAFLKGAAVGAVAGAGLVPEALAQTQPQQHAPHAEATTTAQSHGH